MLISCKQGLFLQRKYTNGFYFSRSASVELTTLHPQTSESKQFNKTLFKPTEPLTDTLVMTTGQRIACKVRTITRKSTTYVIDKGYPINIKNKKVARIHFNGEQKEYLSQAHPNGNPLLQHALLNNKERKAGFAVFGYITTFIIGIGVLIGAPFVGIPILLLFLPLFIILLKGDVGSTVFKIAKGLGKFMAILYTILMSAFVVLLLIAIFGFV